MKSLFNERYETYTPEAIEISKEIGIEIRKLLDRFCNDQMYSTNDIKLILIDEVTLNCSEFQILKNIKFKKGERK
jgi:hypothetical protein